MPSQLGFRRESRQRIKVSGALWIPVIWFVVAGSKSVEEWFGTAPDPVDLSAGSPLNATMERLMDPTQIREWLSLGHEIGAHTLTHPRLSQIPLSRAREEIHSSKKKLEDLFGIPVKHFAYPYGDYNQRIVGIVQEAAFHTACTTDPGCVRVGDDPFRLNRLTVREEEFSNRIASKVRKILRNFSQDRRFAIKKAFGNPS